jgi:hypothetical protein
MIRLVLIKVVVDRALNFMAESRRKLLIYVARRGRLLNQVSEPAQYRVWP